RADQDCTAFRARGPTTGARIAGSPLPLLVKTVWTNSRYVRRSFGSRRGSDRRDIRSSPASTLGAGVNAADGTRASTAKSTQGHHCAVIMLAPPTPARRRATSHCTRSIALVQPGAWSTLRIIAVVR